MTPSSPSTGRFPRWKTSGSRKTPSIRSCSSLEIETKKTLKAGKKVYQKAAIFTERTNFPFKEPETAATAEDAIKISLTYRNKIDLPYVAKLLNADKEAVKEIHRQEQASPT